MNLCKLANAARIAGRGVAYCHQRFLNCFCDFFCLVGQTCFLTYSKGISYWDDSSNPIKPKLIVYIPRCFLVISDAFITGSTTSELGLPFTLSGCARISAANSSEISKRALGDCPSNDKLRFSVKGLAAAVSTPIDKLELISTDTDTPLCSLSCSEPSSKPIIDMLTAAPLSFHSKLL